MDIKVSKTGISRRVKRTHTYRGGMEVDMYKSYEMRTYRMLGKWAVTVRVGHNWIFHADGYAKYIDAKQTGIAFVNNWIKFRRSEQ